MASSDSILRTHQFRLDSEYEARETFPALTGGGDFLEGKRYAVRHVGYSPYDSATVVRFQAQGDKPLDWWWGDEEPDDLCADRFRLVAEFADY